MSFGSVSVGDFSFVGSTMSSPSNADITLSPGGTGGVVASGLRFNGTTISADDSSTININDGLNVDGTANIEGALSTNTSLALASGATVTAILDEDNFLILAYNILRLFFLFLLFFLYSQKHLG